MSLNKGTIIEVTHIWVLGERCAVYVINGMTPCLKLSSLLMGLSISY